MPSVRHIIGRQPILNRNEELVAYELLFRSADDQRAAVDDDSHASASVIVGTLTGFGVDDILGDHKGFINIGFELLMSDTLDILPRDQVVIELLETLQVTAALVERCRALKESGFVLALDDHEYSPEYHDLYEIVDIVKVDLMQGSRERLREMVPRFRRYPMQLLAEKVETREEFDYCHTLGFDLFQGYYFARPSVMEKKRLDDSGATLLKLMRLLNDDAEIHEIERAFRENAGLTYKLLMLVNSVGVGTRSRIETVRHAISLLGRHQIKHWIQLALFAGNDCQGLDSPLVDMAAVRASLMEHLATRHHALKDSTSSPEKAFMTGILSMLERVYDISVHEVVRNLNLSEDVQGALTSRQGVLGSLLHLAERLERVEFVNLGSYLDEMGISLQDMLESQKKAYAWRQGWA